MAVKIDSKIRSIIERDGKVMMTTTREPYPFVADRGDGDFAYDVSGNKFIDFTSFISVYNFGVNANADVRNAVKKQVDRLMHPAFTDFYGELPVRFAEKLVAMFPKGFGRVFYSNSGTEANEAALKFAKALTKRQYVIAFYNAFHGRTYGSLGLTASNKVHRAGFGPFNSVIHAPYPYAYRFPYGDEEECGRFCISHIRDNILEKEVDPNEVAAIVMEPVQGEGGYIVPPKSFVKELRKLASEHGIALISDEVQAGYMRTGRFLALDNFGVEADIYSMAKAAGGGLPFGVTVTRRSLGDMPAGAHSNTFGGNLLAIAAADASLDYVKKNEKSLQKQVAKKGRKIMARLEELKEKYEIIGDVRGLGLMIGMEIVKSKDTKEYAAKQRDAILIECFNNGLLVLPAGRSTIRLIPPITMSEASIDKGLDVLEKAVGNAGRN
ncbi:[LysW]-aminoadipate semialdehyde/glutamate semialdehyde transaminase [uncultured archaeon]|nr:[LysW]-aminoadipate semialdehyde/glutamate semialdehyde transaminase [uncultured archaeon]